MAGTARRPVQPGLRWLANIVAAFIATPRIGAADREGIVANITRRERNYERKPFARRVGPYQPVEVDAGAQHS